MLKGISQKKIALPLSKPRISKTYTYMPVVGQELTPHLNSNPEPHLIGLRKRFHLWHLPNKNQIHNPNSKKSACVDRRKQSKLEMWEVVNWQRNFGERDLRAWKEADTISFLRHVSKHCSDKIQLQTVTINHVTSKDKSYTFSIIKIKL
jgi:hypothetical protein